MTANQIKRRLGLREIPSEILRPQSAVYFLFDDNGTLMYIGQTTNLLGRVNHHRTSTPRSASPHWWQAEKEKERWGMRRSCTRVLYLPLQTSFAEELQAIEAVFISVFRPPANAEHIRTHCKPEIAIRNALSRIKGCADYDRVCNTIFEVARIADNKASVVHLR